MRAIATGLLCLFCGAAAAESAAERWARLARDSDNLAVLAFSQAGFGGDYDGRPAEATTELWGVGESRASNGGLQSDAGALPGRTAAGGFAAEDRRGTVESRSGWRDVWTIGGGTGSGEIVVTGRFDGDLDGRWSWSRLATTLFTTGASSGSVGASASAGVDESGGVGVAFIEPSCGPAPGSACAAEARDDHVSFDYTLRLPFTYGTPVFLLLELQAGLGGLGTATAAAALAGGVDRVVLPDGAWLTAASGALAYDGTAWRYGAAVLPVPAGDGLHLMAGGLLVLALMRRRRLAGFGRAAQDVRAPRHPAGDGEEATR